MDGSRSAQALSAQHRIFLAAATSDNTRRTYRSAIRHFLAWGGVLPTDAGMVIRYLLAYAQTLNARTLALRLTALRQWHLHQGFADPVAVPTVRKTLAGIERIRGTPAKKAKALPVDDLECIARYLDATNTLKAKRDNAMLQIGFYGGLRRSEIAALRIEHVAWEKEGLVITLARSKTDQHGAGISRAIPYGLNTATCCPATALRAWLVAAGISSGPVFRPVSQWQVVAEAALHPGSVNTILTASAKAAGLSYGDLLSSHSLRRGMATSAHRAGADFRDIKRQGGWRHDGTVHGYIEEAGQFEENAAGMLLGHRHK
jgi:integrase